MHEFVGHILFAFILLVAIVFHALLALAYICVIMLAAMDGGTVEVAAAVLLGGIGVVLGRVLYGLLAVPATDLVARLVEGTAAPKPR
jgi:hypothetical protein